MKILYKKKVLFSNVKVYSSFLLKFKGLMFSRKLKDNEAIIFPLKKESRIAASIHMLFVFFPVYVVWLNKEKIIVDIKKVYPFQFYIQPKEEASFVIEVCKSKNNLKVGYKLTF